MALHQEDLLPDVQTSRSDTNDRGPTAPFSPQHDAIKTLPSAPTSLTTFEDDETPSVPLSAEGIPVVKKRKLKARPDGQGGYKCQYCPQEFRYIYAWRDHMSQRHERPYKCTYAGCKNHKGFLNPIGLRRHYTNVHLKEIKWFCASEDCIKHTHGFVRFQHLKRHEEQFHGNYISQATRRGEQNGTSGGQPTKRTKKQEAESPEEEVNDPEEETANLEERIRYHLQELGRLAGLLQGVRASHVS
ncbi:hypothetical protein AYO20_09107 [Fonsecaea nubica]|uniref:C2H2-type domain-containing protein n=1 Tax=Fonsecaea nubica TaxID=856822 RepID=A0A178CKY1_9EURO|nr:hypothetical protein AYO20_09107 [Fonsecaea nubica]OAL29723.1 hypothetical protein AYO20_09107 [Fonsecaea nubica]